MAAVEEVPTWAQVSLGALSNDEFCLDMVPTVREVEASAAAAGAPNAMCCMEWGR